LSDGESDALALDSHRGRQEIANHTKQRPQKEVEYFSVVTVAMICSSKAGIIGLR
jgi:ribosomal protein S25